jgi:hypothetical protein
MSDEKIKKELEQEAIQAQRKEQEKNFKDFCEAHGHRPVSRRDLLGSGLISFAASMTFPSLAGLMLPRQLMAAENCPSSTTGGSGLAPFITFNLRGGAMLAANYLPTDQGGQPLPTYNVMGLGNGAVPIEREFGNVPFAGDDGSGEPIAKLLVGIREAASRATLDRTAFVTIPVRSRDDSGVNAFDASGMVARAGLLGSELPNLGRSSSETGMNHQFAKVKPPTPLSVGNYSDIAGALNLGATGPLSSLNEDQRIRVLSLVNRLSQSQAEKVNQQAGGRMLASLVNCALNKNIEIARAEKPSVDVREDSALAEVWGVNSGTNNNNESVIFGSMVKAGLMGTAGTVTLERGGYDYHNGTRATGDGRDRAAGVTIGRILETAANMGQKVFIYVTSDGACVSPVSDDRNAPWRSDRGSAGIVYMLAYDPAARPETSGHMIGHFTEGQAADNRFITGGSPELATCAVFANYLKFNNRMDLLQPVIGNTFNTNQLDQIIKFG